MAPYFLLDVSLPFLKLLGSREPEQLPYLLFVLMQLLAFIQLYYTIHTIVMKFSISLSIERPSVQYLYRRLYGSRQLFRAWKIDFFDSIYSDPSFAASVCFPTHHHVLSILSFLFPYIFSFLCVIPNMLLPMQPHMPSLRNRIFSSNSGYQPFFFPVVSVRVN